MKDRAKALELMRSYFEAGEEICLKTAREWIKDKKSAEPIKEFIKELPDFIKARAESYSPERILDEFFAGDDRILSKLESERFKDFMGWWPWRNWQKSSWPTA